MTRIILLNLERAINYLEGIKARLQGKEPFKTTLTKREQVRNLVKKMARQMDFPADVIAHLDNLDEALLVASDDQVDLILNHVTKLINDAEKEHKRTGIDFKQALEIHKIQNN